MLSRTLTLVLFVSFVGCKQKEFKKNENSSVNVVQNLNEGKPEEVVEKLSSKSDLSPRERSYLASAYQQLGGIDVFSLYNLLEIELFHKSALDWKDLSKDKNPYLKFMKSQEDVNLEERKKKRLARWEKFEPIIIKRQGLAEKLPTLEEVNRNRNTAPYSDRAYEYSNKAFSETSQSCIDKKFIKDTELWECWGAGLKSIINENKGNYDNLVFDLQNYYADRMYLDWSKRRYLDPEGFTAGPFSGIKWEVVYMNILWNTYEAIPLIKKLPTLTDPQQEQLTKALDHYYMLLPHAEFRHRVLKQMAIVSVVSLMSYYKNSFDMEEVKDIQDLFCSFDPTPILDNYPMIRKRLVFMAKVSKETDGELESFEDLNKKIESAEDILPPELTEEQKQKYLDDVEKFKINRCFNG